jgi:membrane protein implicated in regulation of membrane protease activity
MWLTWEMWGISALLLLGGELWTQSFVLLWPALGAAATSVGAYLGLDEHGQLILFSVTSMVLLALSRTVFRKLLFPPSHEVLSNAEAIPGTTVLVLEAVGDQFHPGTVRLGGEVWSAYSADGRSFDKGNVARVARVDGLKLVIEAPGKAAGALRTENDPRERKSWE